MNFNDIKSPEELLKFMSSNVIYGFIDKDGNHHIDDEDWDNWFDECLVQTGEKLLDSLVGTCWDQVELERLWFSKNNYKFKTIFLWFEADYVNNYPTHSFLVFEDNNKYYWFENAFHEYEGIYEFDSYDDAIKYVKNAHLQYALSQRFIKSSDEDKLRFNIYEKLNKCLTVAQYLEHVTN